MDEFIKQYGAFLLGMVVGAGLLLGFLREFKFIHFSAHLVMPEKDRLP